MGASAGAHLALLQGYKHIGTNKPKAIISLFAPVDLVALYNNPALPLLPLVLSQIIGSTPTQDPAAWQQSSPINYITAQCSPTIVFHGGQDPLVPAAQADLLVNKLKATGVTNQFVYYPNQGHGWEGADLDDTINKAIAFLQQQVP
jgi:dipeptidyl aminopeptidase/acylaminoacyl peptidase